jgi:ubiquinone biosynthesis protein
MTDRQPVSDGVFPSFERRLGNSRWARELPGLLEEAQRWHAHALVERPHLKRRARRLVASLPAPRDALRLGQVAFEAVRAVLALGVTEVAPRRALSAVGMGAEDDHAVAEGAARLARETFIRLGPTYVKLGQVIASARGLLPDPVVEAFLPCRDEVEPFDPELLPDIIEAELGKPPSEIFADLDEKPLAAASVAQVHAARLRDGREVVVKVLRPGIASLIESDVRLLIRVVYLLYRFWPELEQANFHGVLSLFAETVLEELDLRLEADNMVDLGTGLEALSATDIVVPHPIPGLVSKNVLVMERLYGRKYSDLSPFERSRYNTPYLLHVAMRTVLEGAAIAGTFHGDLHSGNVFLLEDGRFGLMDYGIVARMDDRTRRNLIDLMIAVAKEDTEGIVDAFAAFGAFPEGVDRLALLKEVQDTFEARRARRAREGVQLEDFADGLSETVRVFARHGGQIPKDLVLFLKNLVYLGEAVRALDPDVDLRAEVGQLFDYFAGKYTEEMRRLGAL